MGDSRPHQPSATCSTGTEGEGGVTVPHSAITTDPEIPTGKRGTLESKRQIGVSTGGKHRPETSTQNRSAVRAERGKLRSGHRTGHRSDRGKMGGEHRVTD